MSPSLDFNTTYIQEAFTLPTSNVMKEAFIRVDHNL